MPKKLEKKVQPTDAMQMTDEQLTKARQTMREQMRERFDKWMTVYDEDATDEDIKTAKDAFDAEVAKYQDKEYDIMADNAHDFVVLLRNWNRNYNHWEKGEWKGVIMLDKVLGEIEAKTAADPAAHFVVDYSTLMYLYKVMSQPAGYGIESAKAMAELENFDPVLAEPKKEEYYITYSHLYQNIVEQVSQLMAVDKMLKLMRERINIETAGIKFDWKISEVEEFIQLHDEWLGEAAAENVGK